MNLYQQRVLDARRKFLKLNKAQEKELLTIYQKLAKELSSEIASCRTSSSKQYLSGMEEIVQAYMNELNIKLSQTIKCNIQTSSQIASSTQLAYYESIGDDVKLRSMFNKSVINTSSNTVKKLVQGKYYEDGKTLDKRIWNVTKSNAKDIDTLIKVNVAKGANARNLAQQLERYINPTKRIEAKTLEVGMNKSLAYQAQRLARTSITHAFAETTIENAKKNPFNKGIKWNLSASHSARMHGKTDECDDYDGKVFKPNEVPLQHPNCLCYFTEENEDINKVIKDLKAWNKGKSNPKLDKWYKDNNELNIIEYPKKKSKEIQWKDFKGNYTEFKNKREIKKHLIDNYKIKFSDSTKYPINKDILQDSVNWLDKFHSYFEGFKEIDPVELPIIKIKARMNAVGYYQYYINKPQAVELALNGAYFTDKGYNNSYIEQCIKSKWTVANAKPHKTFVHEYGHHIADSMKWLDKDSGISSNNWCKEFIENTIEDYNKKYNENISFKDIAELVSRYGGTKPEEAFAEIFAEYFGGENPRKFAKVFGEKVEKKLKEYIKMKG
ncbi:exonuclease SbcC [Clostridium sporogenes]|uniref:exonuclease SbcC n=1 Tax=Clostridium sporogenes TaxID=1509 RepID=UPI002237195B|nr:exonuclease SbcC [Clostridium sporogenes]MCW6075482.1 exonuclease SbcC [Clostridium sporogenes]